MKNVKKYIVTDEAFGSAYIGKTGIFVKTLHPEGMKIKNPFYILEFDGGSQAGFLRHEIQEVVEQNPKMEIND